MIFSKLFRRPTITLPATSRLYGWTTTSGREAPSTACAALQSSVKGGILGVLDKVARTVGDSRVLATAFIAVLIIGTIVIVGNILYLMVLSPLIAWDIDWMIYIVAVAQLVALFVIIAFVVILYHAAKWAGEHLCPIKLQFSQTNS